jgi:hypothetical protein
LEAEMGSRRTRSVLLAVALALPLAGLGSSLPAGAAEGPVTVSAVPGNGYAKISWTIAKKPAIRYLIVEAWINGRAVKRHLGPKAWERSALFSKLKNGVRYVFQLRVQYKGSTAWFRHPSAAVKIGTPLPPTNAHATSGGPGTLQVSVTAPKANGSPINLYSATCTSADGGATKTGVSQAPAVPTVVVAGLTSGHTYKCVVFARNARGRGLNSAPSNAVAV